MGVHGLRWSPRNSLPGKLAVVVLVFVAAVGTVHGLSLDRLTHVNLTSTEVRNRWLDTLRQVDRLHDLISDVRTTEAEVLLSPDPGGGDDRRHNLHVLVSKVGREIDQYRSHQKDPDELLAFGDFMRRW